MFKKIFTLLIVVVAIFFNGSIANAEMAEYIGVGKYYMEDENELLVDAEAQAEKAAKLDALRKVAVHVEERKSIENMQLTDIEVITITAGVVYTTDTFYTFDTTDEGVFIITAQVTVEVDMDKALELIDAEIARRSEQNAE